MATKYAQQKALRVYINNVCEACIVTDLSKEEEEYVINLFYTCENTSGEVKYGLKFTGIYEENIQVGTAHIGEGQCIYKDEVRHIFTFPEVIYMLLNPELDYTLVKHEKLNIEYLFRKLRIEGWCGEGDYAGSIFVRAKLLSDAVAKAAILREIMPDLPNEAIHVGNNAIWFDEVWTFIENKKTIKVKPLDDDKVKKFKADAAGAYHMHVWAGLL